jgi:hypothetical protein
VFSKELIDLLIQVVKSWEVIAVTVALVLYMLLISYVTRNRRRHSLKFSAPRKPKKEAAEPAPQEEEVAGEEEDLLDEE